MKSLLCRIGMACLAVALCFGAAAAQSEESTAAGAQNTCGPHRATILDLAERIIAERTQVKRFSERHFGTAATYLTLRYGDLDLASGMNLLVRVQAGQRRAPRDLENVQLAFAISKLGAENGLETDDRPQVEIFSDFSPIVVRQLLLADAGESFFRLLTAVRADPELAENFEARYFNGLNVHSWILDQSDEFKQQLARNAEAAGELGLAAMVLGSRRELSEYFALLGRHPNSDLEVLAGPKRLMSSLATLPYRATPVPVAGDNTESKTQRAEIYDVMRAAFRMGGTAWLSILYNQSGAGAPIAQASRDFLAELEAGRLNPRTDLEPAWVYLYEQLANEMGADKLSEHMAGFALPRFIRHYADLAQTSMNWIIARQALVPYLTVVEQELPPRPALLTPDFDWDNWTRQAVTLKGETADLPSSVDPKLVLELLLAKGDVARALDFAGDALSPTERLWFYRDVMIRLDQRCDGYTIYEGGELVLAGDILYRFE